MQIFSENCFSLLTIQKEECSGKKFHIASDCYRHADDEDEDLYVFEGLSESEEEEPIDSFRFGGVWVDLVSDGLAEML